MNKTLKQAIFLSLVLVLALGEVAAVYAVDQLPEESYLDRLSVPQGELSQYETFEEAATALTAWEEEFLSTPILWTSPRGQLELTLRDMGVETNVANANEFLLGFSERTNPITRLQTFMSSYELPLSVKVRPGLLKAPFDETDIQQGVKNASFNYSNGKLNVDPEQIGYGVDTVELATLIESYWENGSLPHSAPLPLRTSEPEYTVESLAGHLEAADALSERSFVFKDPIGDKWKANAWEHMDWFLPEDEAWVLNEAPFLTYVEEVLVAELESEPISASITETEDGTFEFEGSARMGIEVDQTLLAAEFTALVNSEENELFVPVIEEAPEVTVSESLAARGITELLGFGYSSFSGSPYNRIRNVNRGMEQFNGIIIAQGEELDFTTLMGPIDAAHGWLPELVIKGDDTIPEYGGGLCQVSSTMFRAALYTGLEVTQRRNHSYAVSYYAYPYGYGLDATVYDPAPNLKFKNDSPADILIQGYTDGYGAYFVFYGTNDGRSVEMEGPYAYDYRSVSTPKIEYTSELPPGERKFKEYAHTGFKVDWFRTVYYGDGSVGERENIHSDYAAKPPQYFEGKAAEETAIGG